MANCKLSIENCSGLGFEIWILLPIFAKVFLLLGVLVVYVVEVCLVVVCASILHVFVEHTMHSSFNKGKQAGTFWTSK